MPRAPRAVRTNRDRPSRTYPALNIRESTLTFVLRSALSRPEPQKVQIQPGGSDNGLGKGPFDMVRDDRGIWSFTTPPAVPDFHYYWLILDGFVTNDSSSRT